MTDNLIVVMAIAEGRPTKNPQQETEGRHQGASTISTSAIALAASGKNEETAVTFLVTRIGGT